MLSSVSDEAALDSAPSQLLPRVRLGRIGPALWESLDRNPSLGRDGGKDELRSW